jgi:DNA-binding Xre family transcriptional regulator
MSNPYVGSSFDDYLEEEGVREEVTAAAILRVVSWLLTEEMHNKGISKTEMAERMGTSRAQLDRILKGDSPNVGVETLARAAKAVNKELVLDLR